MTCKRTTTVKIILDGNVVYNEIIEKDCDDDEYNYENINKFISEMKIKIYQSIILQNGVIYYAEKI